MILQEAVTNPGNGFFCFKQLLVPCSMPALHFVVAFVFTKAFFYLPFLPVSYFKSRKKGEYALQTAPPFNASHVLATETVPGHLAIQQGYQRF